MKKNKRPISHKKNLVKLFLVTIFGLLASLYIFLVIYTNYISPPVAQDGDVAARQFTEMQRMEFEKDQLNMKQKLRESKN